MATRTSTSLLSLCSSQSPRFLAATRPAAASASVRFLHQTIPSLSSAAAPASSDPVVITREPSGVAILTLNRPKSLNALTEEVGDAFREAVATLSADDSVRAVVLTGAGRAFSAGGDLGFLRDRITTTPQKNVEVMRQFYDRFLSVRKLPVPVIAAINGHAIGAGFCLALACDMRVAAKPAKVGLNFTRIGMHPGMAGSHTLPILVGNQTASLLLLTGDLVSADDAARYGLVLSSVEPDQVVAEAKKIAERIAKASPVAVRGTLKTLRMRVDDGLERALQREADSQAHGYASPDYPEGLDAIVEKRDPVFQAFNSYAK
ncbi:ClpP/crotonase [Gonapodya prolifera JEL478]|uniref:ClpP/crotonase n=1 Tax=Gonapodya prolifera (strain JEL478) TaxID=1344416 RepID=A0A139APT0_GONPJ|nr:ClpP/crotonase [Gonapodya prolifera JEL478]|eukprot:KXS18728.1 ClpP/crotonase [Gonapodya prolifera JEL478]